MKEFIKRLKTDKAIANKLNETILDQVRGLMELSKTAI